jgi:hypothetical protein
MYPDFAHDVQKLSYEKYAMMHLLGAPNVEETYHCHD